MKIFAAILLLAPVILAAPPGDAVPLDAAELPLNWRLHVEFSAPAEGAVRLGKDFAVPLAKGSEHDVAVEHPAKGAPVLRVWSGGKLVRGPEEVSGLSRSGAQDFPDAKMDLGWGSLGGALLNLCYGTGRAFIVPQEESDDRRTVTLTIPALASTMCYELTTKLRSPDGVPVVRSLHGTIHQLAEK